MHQARIGIRMQRREGGRGSTCQRGLRISFTGGLGLCVGRHDGVKHGWRQPRYGPIIAGGFGGGAQEPGQKTQNNKKLRGVGGWWRRRRRAGVVVVVLVLEELRGV